MCGGLNLVGIEEVAIGEVWELQQLGGFGGECLRDTLGEAEHMRCCVREANTTQEESGGKEGLEQRGKQP